MQRARMAMTLLVFPPNRVKQTRSLLQQKDFGFDIAAAARSDSLMVSCIVLVMVKHPVLHHIFSILNHC